MVLTLRLVPRAARSGPTATFVASNAQTRQWLRRAQLTHTVRQTSRPSVWHRHARAWGQDATPCRGRAPCGGEAQRGLDAAPGPVVSVGDRVFTGSRRQGPARQNKARSPPGRRMGRMAGSLGEGRTRGGGVLSRPFSVGVRRVGRGLDEFIYDASVTGLEGVGDRAVSAALGRQGRKPPLWLGTW